jgi:hypothetical protein
MPDETQQETSQETTQTTDTSTVAPDFDGDNGTLLTADNGKSGDVEGQTGEGAETEGQQETTEEVDYSKIEIADGLTMDQLALDEYIPVFKELNLNAEQAKKLVDIYANQQLKAADEYQKTVKAWENAARADKEYGGDKLNESLSIATAALEKFGTSELKQVLNESGLGNHPEVIRFMKRVGDAIREDVPPQMGKPTSVKQSREQILYGDK